MRVVPVMIFAVTLACLVPLAQSQPIGVSPFGHYDTPVPGGSRWQDATIRCESLNGNYRECRTSFRGPWSPWVLVENLSNTRCVQGRNWGSIRSGRLWIRDGCRGVFAPADGGYYGDPDWQPGQGGEYGVIPWMAPIEVPIEVIQNRAATTTLVAATECAVKAMAATIVSVASHLAAMRDGSGWSASSRAPGVNSVAAGVWWATASGSTTAVEQSFQLVRDELSALI